MKKFNRHNKFEPIFTKRFISDLFYHISNQINLGVGLNAYNVLFAHRSHIIFTNEKIKRDYESGNLRKIKIIFKNFVKRIILNGFDNFINTINMTLELDIFDENTTIYDIDGTETEKLKIDNIHEMKRIVKHLMCCKKNFNLFVDLVHTNFDILCDIQKMRKLQPEVLAIFDNLIKCNHCHAFSYTDDQERAATIIQRNYLYYRDTPVDLKSPNIEKTLWWKVHTKRLRDICEEYELIIN